MIAYQINTRTSSSDGKHLVISVKAYMLLSQIPPGRKGNGLASFLLRYMVFSQSKRDLHISSAITRPDSTLLGTVAERENRLGFKFATLRHHIPRHSERYTRHLSTFWRTWPCSDGAANNEQKQTLCNTQTK